MVLQTVEQEEEIRDTSIMVDVDSIKRASELVNSILFAKGFFGEGTSNDQLLFKSIHKEELQNDEQVQENDKLTINTIYALIQSFDKSKQERSFLLEQLNDKKEIINHYEASNKELNSKNDYLTRLNNKQQNEIQSLKHQLKLYKQDKALQDRSLQQEKHINSSIKTKFEIEIKKKTIMINQLQDKLLTRQKKFHSAIKGNNASFTENFQNTTTTTNNQDGIMDQELEKMMINLSNLITNLTLQNDQNIKFINYLTNYLTILNDFLVRKLDYEDQTNNEIVALPPTPKFFYENFQNSQQHHAQNVINDDISTKISHIIDFQRLQKTTFVNLERLYELMINDSAVTYNNVQFRTRPKQGDGDGINDTDINSSSNAKILQLQQQVEMLDNNLNIAIETNEKWNKKFQELERQKKTSKMSE